jgi:hypothetical protein
MSRWKKQGDTSDEYQPKEVLMTAAQKAAAEREKAALLQAIRDTSPTKVAPDRAAPESLNARVRPVEDEPAPILHDTGKLTPAAATPAVLEAQAELARVEAEIADLERQLAEAKRREAEERTRTQAATDAKRLELGRQQAEADARAREADLQAAKVSMQGQIDAAATHAAQTSSLEAQRRREKLNEWFTKLGAMAEEAKLALARLREIDHEWSDTLTKLGSMTWREAPAAWGPALRTKMERQVYMVAGEIAQYLRVVLDQGPKLIAAAESDIASGRDSRTKWEPEIKYYTRDQIFHVNRKLEALVYAQKQLEGQGARYVQDHAGEPEVVIVLRDHSHGHAAKEALLARMNEKPKQRIANGVPEDL